jgi:hypothetical protein
MTDLCVESAVDCILLANAPLLEDGPWQGGQRFLQCKGLEPARMCLLCCLSQGVRHRLQRQNMILHLAGPRSHLRRIVPTPQWALGLDNQQTGNVAQWTALTWLTVPWRNCQLVGWRHPGGPRYSRGLRRSMLRTAEDIVREGHSVCLAYCM